MDTADRIFAHKAVNYQKLENYGFCRDEKGFYIQNDINSVIIEIKISDNDTTYKMETLYNGGMPTFIQYYGDISFECTKIDYNKNGRVSFMIFEQKTS